MDKTIYNILKTIEDNGFKAYVVGGYVRDYILLKSSSDIDIATNATPKDIIELFKNYNNKEFSYGSVHINIPGYHIEITTFRKDCTYSDGRRPDEVFYVDTIEEDVLRRDFTINSLYMDKDKNIIDPVLGINDLKKKTIRMIGDNELRVKEDALRILRCVRFATILNFKIDDNLKTAIKNNRYLLKQLSYDRKKEELFKIFTSSNKKYGVKLLLELDLCSNLEITNIELSLRTNDIMGIYAMCFSDNYSFTKAEKEIITDVRDLFKEKLTPTIIYKYGSYPVSIVCDLKKLYKRKYIKIYNNLSIHDVKDINISADEICDILSVKPSFILKDVYSDLEDKIINKKLKNDNSKIREYLEKNYGII